MPHRHIMNELGVYGNHFFTIEQKSTLLQLERQKYAIRALTGL